MFLHINYNYPALSYGEEGARRRKSCAENVVHITMLAQKGKRGLGLCFGFVEWVKIFTIDSRSKKLALNE